MDFHLLLFIKFHKNLFSLNPIFYNTLFLIILKLYLSLLISHEIKILQKRKKKTLSSLLEIILFLLSILKTTPKQSQVMQKLTFDDLYFVRMKFEKSIELPKAPPKTPKKQSNPFLAIIQAYKPFSPLKSAKQQKQKPSQYQIDKWIAKKQVSVKAEIRKQKSIKQLFKDQNCQSQKLRLRPKQNWEMLRLSKPSFKREQPQNTAENQIFPTESNQQVRNRGSTMKNVTSLKETKKSHNNSTQSDEAQLRNGENSNSNLNYFSFLLKSKQNKETIRSLSGLKKLEKGYDLMNNRQKKGVSITKSYSELKLSSKLRSYSQRAITYPNPNDSLQTTKQIQRYSLTRKMPQKSVQDSSYSISKGLRMNPIYDDTMKGNRLIKNYENREVSPVERRDLKDKYYHLEKRLESILRSVKTEKLSSH